MASSAGELVAAAKAKIENLGPDAVAAEVEDGAMLVDLREPEELEASGCIPGAAAVARGMLEFRADPATPYHQELFQPDARIILYCASGGRSALAAATLREMGYTNVAHLDGGLNAWKEAGKPFG